MPHLSQPTQQPAPRDPAAAATVTSTPPAQSPTKREDQLRSVAHEIFAAQGLGVPLSDIAKAAGIGVATLYRRYKDKDILILDVYREAMGEGERFAIAANQLQDPWQGIEQFLRRGIGQLQVDRGMRELVLGGYVGGAGWARGSTHEELLLALEDMQSRVTAQLELLVGRAHRAHVVREDFRHQDMLLITAMAQAALPADPRGAAQVGQRALQLLLEGIRPPSL